MRKRKQDNSTIIMHPQTQAFKENILSIMDTKNHWAWPYFSQNGLTKDQLKIHFQQEYEVYVRDFPVYLARIYGNNPPAEVRGMLAENIYEEDTGKLSLGRSHPHLFLEMMEGLKFTPDDFQNVKLFPASQTYRNWLWDISLQPEWVLGVAALTIFVEGSVKDRQELSRASDTAPPRSIEAIIQTHPLVKYHGVQPKHMDLIRAHQMVEAGHRHDAYTMVLSHAKDTRTQEQVLHSLKTGMQLWLKYRDEVAEACGLTPP